MANSVYDEIKAKWDEVAIKYSVHPEVRRCSMNFASRGYKPETELDLEGIRAQFMDILKSQGVPDFDGQIRDIVIPSERNKSGIPARVYTSTGIGPNPAILVYYHGGGLVSGTMDGYDEVIRRIADWSKAIIVNVDYRLLPNDEDPYSPLNDSVDATKWVLENKVALGGQTSSKVGIVGDSAGGLICICVSFEVPEVDFQILIYPIASFDFNTTTGIDFNDIPSLNTTSMKAILSHFFKQNPNADKDIRYNPALRENVESLPPTLMLLGEIDPLTDAAVAYARKLNDAGVPIEWININAFAHGFLLFPEEMPTGFEQGVCHLSRFVRYQVGLARA